MKQIMFLFLSFAWMMVLPMSSVAQDVRVPQWEKFVTAKKDRVNLRQKPNAQSPHLFIHRQMYWHELSWKDYGNNFPFYLTNEMIVPVIKEQTGWLLVYIEPEFEAWVRKDLCSFCTPGPMTIEYTDSNDRQPFARIKGEDDLYVSWYVEPNLPNYQYVHFGKKFGKGILWMDYGKESIDFVLQELNISKLEFFNPYKLQGQHVRQFMDTHEPIGNSLSYKHYKDIFTFEFNPATYKYSTITQRDKINAKIVVANDTNGLQVHQSANMQSAKLIFLEDKEQPFFSFNIMGALKWDRSSFNRSLVTPIKAKVMTVIGEEGGWYKVQVEVNEVKDKLFSGSAIGYVPKKDCHDTELLPITQDALLQAVEAEGAGVRFCPITANNTCAMIWGQWPGGFSTWESLCLGRLSQDKKILKMGGNLSYRYDSEKKAVLIGFSKFEGKRLIKIDTEEPDFLKMTTNDIERLQDENDTGFYDEAYVNIKGLGIMKLYLWTEDGLEITSVY